MFKKSKSTLALTLSVAMLATMVTIPGVASAATSTQLAGKDRYETALKIVEAGWTSSTNAVITTGEVMADALSAAPLAYAKGQAPILLTKTNSIPAGVLNELKTLGVTNVYIVGGVGAVSKTVADQLAAAGLTITRVEGKNRFETSLAVAKAAFGVAPAEVVIANGLAYADALSVSSVAARKGMPILLVDNSGLSADQAAYISGKTVYAVGGTGVLNAAVVTAAKAERLSGLDRYETNAAILAKFKPDYSKIYLAKGTPANLVDALAGSVLAAKTNSPVVLVDENNAINTKLADVVKANITATSAVVKLGGTVTDVAAAAIENLKAKDLSVTSVSAINATQVVVNFTTAVDPASLFVDGVSGAFLANTVSFTTIDGVPSGNLLGELSADGKTLTVTAQNALSKRYNVVVNLLTAVNKMNFIKYDEVVNFAADKIAPTIVSTTMMSASSFKVTFSEPLSLMPNVSYKLADGTVVVANGNGVTSNFIAGAKEVTFTIGSSVLANKQVIATFIGSQDQAGNLLTPNPATVSFVKGAVDGVAPTVTSLTAINNKTLEVKFSEQLLGNFAVTGFNGTLTYTQDSTDKTKYTIKSNTMNTGLASVSVSAGFSDLSGEIGAAYSKVVNFDLDTVAPKVASSTVTTVNTAEFLVVTFDEAVTTNATLDNINVTGTKLDSYITSAITPVSVPVAQFVQDTTNKNVYRIALANLLGSNDTKGASYNLTLTGKTLANTTIALVNDISGNGGPSSTTANVTRNVDGVAPVNTKASLDTSFSTNGITVNSDKTITVRFNQELDGVSATNLSNYSFAGAVVEKAVLSPYGTKQDVTLTIKNGSNAFTGVRNVTIGGVKAKNGLAMDTVNTTESLVENVAPTVTSAKLTAPGVITLTFNEAVYNSIDIAAQDFDLFIGGIKVTATTLDTQDIAKGLEQNTLTLTIGGTALTAANLTSGLSIKPATADTLNIADANDNVLSVSTVYITQ